MGKIEILGNAYVVPTELQQWYKLVGVAPTASGLEDDVPMEDVSDAPSPSDTVIRDESSPPNTEDPPKAHDNNIVSFIDILLRASVSVFFCPYHY